MGSLRFKLSLVSGSAIVMIVIALVIIIIVSSEDTKQSINDLSSDVIENSVLQQISSVAETEASNVVTHLIKSQKTVISIAASMQSMSNVWLTLDQPRVQAIELLKYQLESDNSLLGAYVAYEPNQFDNLDDENQTIPLLGSDNTGRFVPYVYRDGSSIGVEPLVGYEDQTRDENGVRAGEYYLCAKDTKKTCITDPYLYPIGDKKVLLTSIVAPQLKNGAFQGIAGVDISLEFLQAFTEKSNATVYDGIGDILIVSQRHIIAGSTAYPELVGSKLNSNSNPTIDKLLTDSKDKVETSISIIENTIYAIAPLTIDGVHTGWKVMIKLPKSVITNAVESLTQLVQDSTSGMVTKSILFGVIATTIMVFIMLALVKHLLKPVNYTVQVLSDLAQGGGDLTNRLTIKSKDEMGIMAINLNAFLDQMHGMVTKIRECCGQLSHTSSLNNETAEKTSAGMNKQRRNLEQIATAVTQMSSSASEVAHSVNSTADAVKQARADSDTSSNIIKQAVLSITKLSEEVTKSNEEMKLLDQESTDIGQILVTIQNIAEQTNLLALNAAIEAARAGEQGRGFAVVADEVRTLAASTQESAGEIQRMISALQQGTKKIVNVMDTSLSLTDETVDKINESSTSIDGVIKQMNLINEMAQQIAAASQEQSSVASEISENIVNVDQAAQEIGEYSADSRKFSNQSSEFTGQLKTLISEFKL